MRLEDLDYDYPKDLIATHPASPRDAARLLVMDRRSGALEESVFKEIGQFLKPGDVLVFNKTKVIPARILATKETGGEIEVLFLEEREQMLWEVMVRGKLKEGTKISLPEDLEGVALGKEGAVVRMGVNKSRDQVVSILEKYGQVPLPPYIKRQSTDADKEEYQTVFSTEPGSAAAPTAGLHFTKELIRGLSEKGVGVEYLTLHVGLGTFAPVKTEAVEEHQIHSEQYEISEETAKKLTRAKREGRRIIAVGTTAVRALESAVNEQGEILPRRERTKLFIYPGYKFRFVDGMVTNFHTPKSSLLALVYAFAGEQEVKRAYRYAIEKKMRLFSYGDGMLIL